MGVKGHVLLLDQDYASVVDSPHLSKIFARNHIQKHHLDMVECLMSWLMSNLLLSWYISALTRLSILVSSVSLKFQGKILSFKMHISKKKLILLFGIIFLEQSKSATLSLPKGKF